MIADRLQEDKCNLPSDTASASKKIISPRVGIAIVSQLALERRGDKLADDAMLRANRSDGTGWDWEWADWRRLWMDRTPSHFAYRCLPLTIANQLGLWVKNPVGFTAVWYGLDTPGSVEFQFHAAADVWKQWINDQFGFGIITWNTPLLFRTRPSGSRPW